MPISSKRTNSDQKENALKPIVLRMGIQPAMNKVDEILSKYGFDKYKATFDYHEIYGSKGQFEYTISFFEDFNKTHISILIYSEKRVFSLKKNLKEFALYLREKLKDYME